MHPTGGPSEFGDEPAYGRRAGWNDYTGVPASPPPSQSPTPPSPAHTAVVVEQRTPGGVKAALVCLTLAVLAVGALALTSARSGNNWRVEAENAARQIRTLEAAPRAELAELRELLDRSEADVARLEARLAALADEKAQARDSATAAAAEAAFLQELAVRAASITEWLTACIGYQDTWAEILVNVGSGYWYDDAEIDRFIADMAETCARAQFDAEALQEFVAQ